VQNVWPINGISSLKLTVAYYTLPDETVIHRRAGGRTWGVEPNLSIESLPEQTKQALELRRDADVLDLTDRGVRENEKLGKDPLPLLTDGIDLQLETAVLLARAAIVQKEAEKQAARDR
jgi:hypothetical protein